MAFCCLHAKSLSNRDVEGWAAGRDLMTSQPGELSQWEVSQVPEMVKDLTAFDKDIMGHLQGDPQVTFDVSQESRGWLKTVC